MDTSDHSRAQRRCWPARRRTASRLIGTGTTPIPSQEGQGGEGGDEQRDAGHHRKHRDDQPADAGPEGQQDQPAETAGAVTHRYLHVAPHPSRRVFPGRLDQVAHARRFVTRVLDSCPVAEDALLCTSELASNAVRHTRTARDGKFQVVVWRGQASVCVAVLDDGSDTTPVPGQPGKLTESGHGLLTVQTLAAWWGHHTYRDGSTRGTVVWFRLDWKPA